MTQPEPISLTVHSANAPDLADLQQAQQRQTRGGRFKMLMVLLACALPVLASYFTYYVIRPGSHSNYGDLIQPSKSLPAQLGLKTLADQPVDAASLRGQWLLMVVAGAACTGDCEQHLFLQRQLREMLGRERDRIDKIWLLPDGGTPASALLEAVQGVAAAQVLRVDRAALQQWLTPAAGRALEDHLYVVDPMGEWMMRFPANAEPARMKRDLDRLLKASAFWDKAGR